MNKDNAKDYLPLVQALAEGKVIQHIASGGIWQDIDDPSFMPSANYYRIKPEPVVVYVILDADGTPHSTFNKECEAQARRHLSNLNTFGTQQPYTLKKFVEEYS